MKSQIIYIVTILAVLTSTSFARLGETEQESEKRYGPSVKNVVELSPLLKGAKSLNYNYKGWLIKTAYVNGTTAKIRYSKSGRHHKSLYFQEDELASILKAEGAGGVWRKKKLSINPMKALVQTLDTTKEWVNNNGRKAKLFHTSLALETPEAQKFLNAQAQKEEALRKKNVPEF